jgi:hypothetical protein
MTTETTIAVIRSQERGSALAITMLVLMLVTVIGLFALSTTDVEIQISGNERLYQQAFYAADAGSDFAQRVAWETHGLGVLPDTTTDVGTVTLHDSLFDELMDYDTAENDSDTDSPLNAPDITVQMASLTTNIDVDGTSGYLAGAAIQFGAGYEGIGAGMGQGGVGKFYTIDSLSQGLRSSSARVESRYQYIGIPGGAGR